MSEKRLSWAGLSAIKPPERAAPAEDVDASLVPVENAGAQITPAQNAPAEPAPSLRNAPSQERKSEDYSSGASQKAPAQKTPPQRAPTQKAPPQTAPTQTTPTLLLALPDDPRDRVRAKYSKIPNVIFDSELLVPLNGVARYIYLDFVRLTLGHNRGTCKISRERLADRTGFSESGCVKALRELAAVGLVVVEETDNTNSRNADRGTVYRVYVPAEALAMDVAPPQSAGAQIAPAQSGHMKETLKKSHERPVAHAPAIDVFGIRTIAARLFEAHRNEQTFSHARLAELVRDVLIGQGSVVDEAMIEEAIRGMAV